MKQFNFEELLESVRQMNEIRSGKRRPSRVFSFSPLDVKKIREKMGLSQTQFSRLIHVSINTLQNWEQGRRNPQGPALVLLQILKKDPVHAVKALQ